MALDIAVCRVLMLGTKNAIETSEVDFMAAVGKMNQLLRKRNQSDNLVRWSLVFEWTLMKMTLLLLNAGVNAS